MTIDESIERFKALAEKGHIIFSRDPDIAEKLNKEYRQVAEWLEELKAYREQHQALCDAYDVNTVEDIYDKAIDDVIKAADKLCGYYAGECKNLTRDDLLKIAKELKDNG
jgi:hypothetical protein|nr:MAG TPA: hypothetical protein [Caudoviricetes sp.]